MSLRDHVDLETWQILVSVMETGSFLQSARELALDPSTVSRRIKKLEDKFRIQLIYRDNAGAFPTVAGKNLLAQVRPLLEELMKRKAELSKSLSEFHGSFLVSVPQELAALPFLAVFSRLEVRHPGLRFDYAVQQKPHPEAQLIFTIGFSCPVGSERLAEIPVYCLAAPSYIEKRGVPQQPEELPDHHIVTYENAGIFKRITFSRGDDRLSLPVPARTEHRTALSAAEDAISGNGILLPVPSYLALPYIRSGRLAPVLSDWQMPALSLNLKTTEHSHPFLMSYLTGELRKELADLLLRHQQKLEQVLHDSH